MSTATATCNDARAAALLDRKLTLLRQRRELAEAKARVLYERSRPLLARKALDGDYAAFVQWAWQILEPGTLLRWGPHLDVLCTALQRQMEGDPHYRKLLIVLPPGTGKSIVLAACRDPFQWLFKPHKRTLYISADKDLASRDSRRARDILQSEEYQELLRQAHAMHGTPAWGFKADQNEKKNFENTENGFRWCLGMGDKVTGKRGDDMVIDDPLDAKEALRGTQERIARKMKESNETLGQVLKSRVNDQRKATFTLLMQRLDPDDPAGKAIASGDWKCIVLPMEYDPDLPAECGGPCAEDWRTEPGEVLFPALFPQSVRDELKSPPPNGLGEAQYQGQYNAKPSRKESGKYDPEWFTQVYDLDPRAMAKQLDEVAICCDATFKKTGTSYVCIEVWGRKTGPHRYYLLHEVRAKMGYAETREALKRLAEAWPATVMVIEDKANGSALIDELSNDLPIPVVPWNPHMSKEEREEVYARPALMARSVWLPSARYAKWIQDYIDEFVDMTSANDRRDTTSQMFAYWTQQPREAQGGFMTWYEQSVEGQRALEGAAPNKATVQADEVPQEETKLSTFDWGTG